MHVWTVSKVIKALCYATTTTFYKLLQAHSLKVLLEILDQFHAKQHTFAANKEVQ